MGSFILNLFNLVRGQDEQLLVSLLDANGYPVNISGASAIKLQIVKDDGSVLEIDPSQGFVVGVCSQCWFYVFPLTSAQTQALKLGLGQNIQLKVNYDTKVHFIPILKCLNVKDPIIVA